MFVQLDASKTQATAGLGLGLALARSLVALHGGEIKAQSAGPGKGSEFAVHLPLAGGPVRRAGGGGVVTTMQSSRRILVVDDNIDAASSLGTLLESNGHTVRTCFDGAS